MSLSTNDTKDAQAHLLNHSEQPPSYEPASTGSSASAQLRPEDLTITALPLSLPDAKAPASDIRTYIRSFLYHNADKYDLTIQDAARLASAWRYGSGEELRTYDRPTWDGLFGVELGLVLWKHVQDQLVNERKDSGSKNLVPEIIGVAICSMAILAALITLFNLDVEDGGDLAAAIFVFTMMVFLPFGIGLGCAIHNLRSKVLHRKKNAASQTSDGYVRLAGVEGAIELDRTDMV